MDEMQLKLRTKFMRNLASKIIAKILYKQYGVKVNLKVNGLDISSVGGDTTAKLNIEASMRSDEFYRLMQSVDIE